MLLLYCIGEGGEKRQQQPPEQKNMYLYIVAVLDIYRLIPQYISISVEAQMYHQQICKKYFLSNIVLKIP